jgi:hypothetical protein
MSPFLATGGHQLLAIDWRAPIAVHSAWEVLAVLATGNMLAEQRVKTCVPPYG